MEDDVGGRVFGVADAWKIRKAERADRAVVEEGIRQESCGGGGVDGGVDAEAAQRRGARRGVSEEGHVCIHVMLCVIGELDHEVAARRNQHVEVSLHGSAREGGFWRA